MKQQITKNAIETAFLKLLKERNFEKVMVKDIVEECGLTRNTFYYYYDDTYNIIADIIERESHEIIQSIEQGQSATEALADCLEFLDDNPKIAKHLFCSGKKDEVYRYVRCAVDVVLNYLIDGMTKDQPISAKDRKNIVNTCKYIIQGMIAEWLDQGMKYSLKEEMQRTDQLFHDVVQQAVQNSKQK